MRISKPAGATWDLMLEVCTSDLCRYSLEMREALTRFAEAAPERAALLAELSLPPPPPPSLSITDGSKCSALGRELCTSFSNGTCLRNGNSGSCVSYGYDKKDGRKGCTLC